MRVLEHLSSDRRVRKRCKWRDSFGLFESYHSCLHVPITICPGTILGENMFKNRTSPENAMKSGFDSPDLNLERK